MGHLDFLWNEQKSFPEMYDVGVKNTAVFMYRNHFRSLRKVARYTNTTKSTVHRWLASHPATRNRPPTRRKVTEAVHRAIAKEQGGEPSSQEVAE